MFVPRFLLAFAVLLTATPAGGQRCLEGDAVDQRSLTRLRAAVDEACPCSSFEGTSFGSRRSDYERCARDVLDSAVDAGDLRAGCRAHATAVLEATTCGTSSVACGRLAPVGGPVSSCSVKREASCRGRPGGARLLASRPRGIGSAGPTSVRRPRRSVTGGYAEQVCPEQTHCADVVEWTASTCFDVREDGPYDAGARVLSLTRPSSVDGEPRELETVVWYPAPPGSGDPDSLYGAVVEAPVDPTGGPHPIVLFSHGSCGFERQSLFLTPWLASHGFVVVAPPHPGNTLFEYPGCGRPAATGASAVERPDDMIFVLDTILAENEDPSSPFGGILDPDAIAMSGHSFGGFTTFLVTERDDRIKAAIPLAAAAPPEGRLAVPSLTLIGEVDSVVANERNVAAFRRSVAPKWLVSIRNAGHYAPSDSCFPGPDCEGPGVLEQDEAHARVKRWVLPFLKVVLEGDATFTPFLGEEAGPSFEVSVR